MMIPPLHTPRSVRAIPAAPDDRAALAAALRRSEAQYRAYVAQAREGIWCYETTEPIPVDWPTAQQVEAFMARAYVADCNDAMARMYGLASAAELIGVPLGALLPTDDSRNVRALSAFVEQGYRLIDVESYEEGRDGSPRVILTSLTGMVEEGRLTRVWGTQSDVTERKLLEEQMRQAQKMEAVGRLAGGVAHDFNNILTAILTCSELLLETLEADAPGREDAEEIQEAARRAAELTRRLLVFSRRRSGAAAPSVVDCNHVVADAERLLRRLLGADVSLRCAPRAVRGLAAVDGGALEQVIVNLAVNARDAMPHGGTLTIETMDADLAEPAVHARVTVPAGAYTMLAVSDTGVGMDAAVMAHLFEPFFTTKERGKGTGLGLATVYGIVKQAGGHVAVYSEPGVGSTFRVYLPRVTNEGEPEIADVDAPAVCGGTETVLLVEDEDAVRRLGERVLGALGYHVIVARDGQDALRLAEAYHGTLHLVISDVVMPRMSGRELVDRLRARRPESRVLFLSGYTEAAVAHRGVLTDGAAFLQKPFTPSVLARAVRALLDECRSTG